MIIELIDNVGFPIVFTLGTLGTLASLTFFIAEAATRSKEKHWVFLWGPVLFWVVLLGGWGLINILYGAFAP
jgi:hypothetical protein